MTNYYGEHLSRDRPSGPRARLVLPPPLLYLNRGIVIVNGTKLFAFGIIIDEV